MKNRIIFIILILMLVGTGAVFISCGEGSGNVTFKITNNYSSPVESVELWTYNEGTQILPITISALGGAGQFSATLKKIITGDYMGNLYFTFEDAEVLGMEFGGYSFVTRKSTILIVIRPDGYHDGFFDD